MSNATSCQECGYLLRGLPAGQPCPECGQLGTHAAPAAHPHTAWARCVFAGLALLLVLTTTAVASVLVQPFEQIGGTAPALNLPAPKLWAMPLLQRPIGRTPQLPGIVGTRTAMLSLVAVWLITAPCALPRFGPDEAMRLLTRWTSVILFALAFGALMGAQGLWPSELPPFRMLLVAAVEMPAAILLYLYLHRLAAHVPGRARREAFAQLVWLVPLVTGGAVAMLTMQWWWEAMRQLGLSPRTVMTASIGYGAIAMTVGVAATAAVSSLCLAYFHASFPFARRLIAGGRYVARRARAFTTRLTPERLQRLAVAAGAALLILAMLLGIDRAQWMQTREALGGNLPFVNYPGPKFWATAPVMHMGARYGWDSLVSWSTLVTLNIAAIWLVTARAENGPVLRAAVRWVPVIALALKFALIAATEHGRKFGVDFWGAYYSRFFVIVIALGELPATLLLYWWLSRVAGNLNLPRVAWAFRRLALVVLALAVTAIATFVSSRWFPGTRKLPQILFLASAYAVVAVGAAVCAAGALVSLATAALTGACEDSGPKTAPIPGTRRAASISPPLADVEDLEPVAG